MSVEQQPNFEKTPSFYQSIGQAALFYGHLAWDNNHLDYIEVSNTMEVTVNATD